MNAATRQNLSVLLNATIARFPQSQKRAFKGFELVLAEKVQRLADAPQGVDRWLVYGSGDQPYRVSIRAETCDCQDRAQTCKHKHACGFALAMGVPAPVEVAPTPDPEPEPDPELWAVATSAEVDPLDKEIADKLAELIAAGLDAEADLMVFGNWIWAVGYVDPDLADALGLRWHDRRGVHYWRPVWAAVEAFNEHADLAGLAQKYGVKRCIPRRGRVERSAVELAMLLVPKLNRDLDGELWA